MNKWFPEGTNVLFLDDDVEKLERVQKNDK